MMQRKPALWLMVLALAGAPVALGPTAAWAQDSSDETTDEAGEAEETTTEDETAEPTEEGAPEEATEPEPATEDGDDEEAEAAPDDQELAPEEKIEDAPVPPPASAAGTPAAAGAAPSGGPAPGTTATDAEEATEVSKAGERVNNAAAMGAASPVVTDDAEAKRWLISSSLQTSLGSAVVADQNNDAVFGYSFSATGLYKLIKLWKGRLDAYGFLTFNQNLTEGPAGSPFGGTGRNQFFLQDIQLGVLGRGIYTERNSGIIFGFRSIGRLPTSDLAQANDRVFRWDNGLTATKPFANVGPGTVILSLATTFRKDFGPSNPTLDVNEYPSLVSICASANSASATACYSDIAPLDWAGIASFGARYLLNNGLGFNVAFSMLYNRFHDIRVDQLRFGNGEIVDVNGVEIPVNPDGGLEVDSSRFADSSIGADQSVLLFTAISLSYVFNANWSVSAGMETFQNVFVQRGDNSTSFSNPFFANDPETNATSFVLSGTFTY